MSKMLIVRTRRTKKGRGTAIVQVIISRRSVRPRRADLAAFNAVPLALPLPDELTRRHGDLLLHDLNFHERNAFRKPIRELASVVSRDVLDWYTDWYEASHHLDSDEHPEMLVRLISPRFVLTDQHVVEAFCEPEAIRRWTRLTAQGIVKIRGKRVFQRVVLNAAATIGPPAADLFVATQPAETIKADLNKPLLPSEEEWD